MLKYLTKFMSLEKTKMVILVRTDLGMGQGKIAAQVAHAAVALFNSSLETENPHLKSWYTTGQPKIVLKVTEDCTKTLTSVYDSAVKSGLTACKIYDAGRTQVAKGTLTTIGIGPNRSEEVDKVTKDFKLL